MEGQTPDIYFTGFSIGMSPFDVTMELSKHSPGSKVGEKPEMNVVGHMRTSLEHAKIMAILLSKNLHAFEEQVGTKIPVHPEMAKSLGISPNEDW